MAQLHPQSTAPIDSVVSSADRAWLLAFSAWRMEEGTVSAHLKKKKTFGGIWQMLLRSSESEERLESSSLRTASSCLNCSMSLSHPLSFYFSGCARSDRQQLFSLRNPLSSPKHHPSAYCMRWGSWSKIVHGCVLLYSCSAHEQEDWN